MIRNLTEITDRVYEAAFFDLDGTITDSGDGCLNGIRYMFDKIGFSDYSEDQLGAFLGPPIVRHLMRHFGFSEPDAHHAYTLYKEYYISRGIYESRLYTGIEETLSAIGRAGIKVYLATSKPEPQALSVLKHFHLLPLFSDVFAARHDLGVYDKDQVLSRAISLIGKKPHGLMAGDRSYDILGGKHVGLYTAGVLYGYGSAEELIGAGCDYTVDEPRDLATLLLERRNI